MTLEGRCFSPGHPKAGGRARPRRAQAAMRAVGREGDSLPLEFGYRF